MNNLENKTIVAIDDSPVILRMLEVLLKGKYSVQGFTKGKRALAYLAEKGADLVLLDIDMADMSGFEVLVSIRESIGVNIPVIMLTSNCDEASVLKCVKHGANDYTIKPIDEAVFMKKVEKYLK